MRETLYLCPSTLELRIGCQYVNASSLVRLGKSESLQYGGFVAVPHLPAVSQLENKKN